MSKRMPSSISRHRSIGKTPGHGHFTGRGKRKSHKKKRKSSRKQRSLKKNTHVNRYI